MSILQLLGQLEEIPSLGRGFRVENRFRLVRAAGSHIGGWCLEWPGRGWYGLFPV